METVSETATKIPPFAAGDSEGVGGFAENRSQSLLVNLIPSGNSLSNKATLYL